MSGIADTPEFVGLTSSGYVNVTGQQRVDTELNTLAAINRLFEDMTPHARARAALYFAARYGTP